MTIRQQGGVFGRNPTFNDVTANDVTANDVTATDITSGGLTVQAGVADISAGSVGPSGNAAVNIGRDDTSISTNNPLGYVQFLGSDNTAGSLTAHAYIGAIASSTHAAGSNPTKFVFGTTASGSETIIDNLTIEANGDVTVETGNLVIGTSGKGIDFSATAGTGTSELFSDYEEGDWSPVVRVGSGTGTIVTTGITNAKYTKIGRLVRLEAYITRTDSTAHSGTFIMTGMPFAGYAGQAQIGGGAWFDNYPGTDIRSFIYTNPTFLISFPRVGTTDDFINVQDWDDNRYIYFSINYMT